MKLLIIGAGGIGSWLSEELYRCIEQQQIDPNIEMSIADDDMVELAQVKYQNFTFSEAGQNKAKALAKRYLFTAIPKRIKTEKQLKGYDFIILCVDNAITRIMVINYCFSKNIEFLDLRATGRRISAFPKLDTKEDNLKFVDSTDTVCYSCQEQGTLQQGRIDKGNKIIALVGVQMILNYLRGLRNKPISMAI